MFYYTCVIYIVGGEPAQQAPRRAPKKRVLVIEPLRNKEKKLVFVRGLRDVFPSPRLIPIPGQEPEPSLPGKSGNNTRNFATA